MRSGFEFSFHALAASDATGHGDASLALLGSLGWEIRGVVPAAGGGYVVALQRPQGESTPLPDAPTLAATLEEPLAVPGATAFEES